MKKMMYIMLMITGMSMVHAITTEQNQRIEDFKESLLELQDNFNAIYECVKGHAQ